MRKMAKCQVAVIEVLARLSLKRPRGKADDKKKLDFVQRDSVELSKFKKALNKEGISTLNAEDKEMSFKDIKRSVTSAKRHVAENYAELAWKHIKPKKSDYISEDGEYDETAHKTHKVQYSKNVKSAIVEVFGGSEGKPPMIYIATLTNTGEDFASKTDMQNWFKRLQK